MKGNIDGLKYLFSQGSVNPRDVSDSRGFILMRWALYGGMHNYETVRFLIDQGVLVDEISYDNVWDFIFRGKCSDKEQYTLRCITEDGEGDWVEEQNFPLIHRIIFGLYSKSLATEVEENPSAAYLTDARNRTALDWATARVQLEDMSVLLGYGADPNNMDVTGRTPVLHAVDSHNVSCLRQILEAGGHPNPAMPKGMFRSIPLTAAGFAGMPEMLKLLLDFEDDPNTCNPEGLTGSANYMSLGSQLLPIIPEDADIETINVLASSHPSKVSLAACREALQQRHDYSERLPEAFEELIAIAKAGEAESQSVDSLIESGLFFPARSSFHSDLSEAMARLDSAAVSPIDFKEKWGHFEDPEAD